jgi:hypothetical protein
MTTPYENYMRNGAGPIDAAEIAAAYRRYAWLSHHSADMYDALTTLAHALVGRLDTPPAVLGALHDATGLLGKINAGPPSDTRG